MFEKDYEINNSSGIHLRPAGKIVEICRKYAACEVTIIRDGLTANAKSIMGVIGLGIPAGETIQLQVEGPEDQAHAFFQEFEVLLENKFYDE